MDYGPPTASTMIELQESGGFAGPANRHGVRIVGTTATYSSGSRSEQVTLETADVAAIIDALEGIDFLDLQDDYTTCEPVVADAESATIAVTVSAGSHTVNHYLGCTGGMFDKLEQLERQIFQLSGYNDWTGGS
jgi:hypothetical protein